MRTQGTLRALISHLLVALLLPLIGAVEVCAESSPIKRPPSESVEAHGASPADNEIVQGRCERNGCWWWRILDVEEGKAAARGKLFKVTFSTTEIEYPADEVAQRGYPDKPPPFAEWDPPEETFVLCSETLPAIIDRSPRGSSLSVTVPFRMDGDVAGTHEALANLYKHVCGARTARLNISPERAGRQFDVRSLQELLALNH